MANPDITDIQRIFQTRLDALDHILDIGEKHLPDLGAVSRPTSSSSWRRPTAIRRKQG